MREKVNELRPDPSIRPFLTLPPSPTYALSLYNAARFWGLVSDTGVSGKKGDKTTIGYTNNNSTVHWNNEFYDLSSDEAALQIIHESMHLIQNFSDQILANNAAKLAGSNRRFLKDDDETKSAASLYLNQQIASHCQ